jgi:hypothetical protein
MPYFYDRRKWTGRDDLNPRPQLASVLFSIQSALDEKKLLFKSHPGPFSFFACPIELTVQ